ncbi:MAG: hypothetical protein PHX87_01080 [Candidatus Peribacteraceae bacterium]|nr:hypothetical protein [Candidatus Peribacteraceae bacterium]MDD5742003.1 hypothetical protein [Candidatus Peribacteraceae bacterium]
MRFSVEAPRPIIARTVVWSLLIGVLLVIYQVACSVLISDRATWSEAYRFMGGTYDANWYAVIVQGGYSTTKTFGNIASVAFMPGFPIAAHPVYWLLKTPLFSWLVSYPPQISLLVTAQVCAVVAWVYLILIMRRFAVPPFLIGLSIVMILAQPFSFIMVWGYSESLFLLAVMGFLYWYTKPEGLRNGLTIQAHALVASASRMHGLALFTIPLFCGIIGALHDSTWPERLRRLLYNGLLALSAFSGAVIHFSYLYWKFGDWLLYFHSQMEGWGHQGIGLFGIFNWKIYRPWWRSFVSGYAEGNWVELSGIIVPVFTVLCLLLFVGSLVLARRKRPESISGSVVLFVYGMLYLTMVGVGKLHDFGFTVVGLSRYEFVMMFLLFPFLIIQVRALFRPAFCYAIFGALGLLVIPLMLYHFYYLNLAVNHHIAL